MNALMPTLCVSLFFLTQTSFWVPDPLDEGLIAYYSFNHCDARDETGNGSDGQVFGQPGCRCGVDEDALWLDGQKDFIVFDGPVNNYFTTSDFTISFYIKPERYAPFGQSLLGKRDSCNLSHMFDIQYQARTRQLETYVHETDKKYYPDLSPDMDSTAWQHFVLVREGIRAFTYINGQLRRKSLRCSGVDLTNEAPLAFANSVCIYEGRAMRFKGAVDELRVYDRALSAEEVARLYSRAPVETAELDCFTFLPKNSPAPLPKEFESTYLCASF
ncbi:MAG: LamG domain-containing protein [Bacteroidetes bacterium]|nr:MAG: LamG domain-containing protein [Bacteroidota bacterium]